MKRKLISASLFILLILTGCSDAESKEKEEGYQEEPEVQEVTDESRSTNEDIEQEEQLELYLYYYDQAFEEFSRASEDLAERMYMVSEDPNILFTQSYKYETSIYISIYGDAVKMLSGYDAPPPKELEGVHKKVQDSVGFFTFVSENIAPALDDVIEKGDFTLFKEVSDNVRRGNVMLDQAILEFEELGYSPESS